LRLIRSLSLEPLAGAGARFPAEIINHAVWLYHVSSLSLRDVELLLAERGTVVTHESIRYLPLSSSRGPMRISRRGCSSTCSSDAGHQA
jgi:hypothetical protein